MEINTYQLMASKTAIFPDTLPAGANVNMLGLLYCALKLNGEAGEVAEHIGKAVRDDSGQITKERQTKLLKELGDVLWYLSQLARLLDSSLDDVATMNLIKLEDRARRGTLGGSGSDR